jgi:hypothetical protein
LLYKFKNRNLGKYSTQYAQQWARPSIMLRLSDFYLYYAEVLNEINPGDARIIQYLDEIRTRAGIAGYQQLQSEGKKTGVIGNQVEQRKAIFHERYVELLGEGQRWFDMRRWMICDPTAEAENYGGNIERFTGMNMGGYANLPIGDPNSFYTKVIVENRHWNRAMYWYPVPQNEINKSHLLKQNPLWEAMEIEEVQ